MIKVGPVIDDANQIYHSLPKWLAQFGDVMRAEYDAFTAIRDSNGLWQLHLKLFRKNKKNVCTSVPFNPDGPRVVNGDELIKFGIARIGPGVWVLSESIQVVGFYHGYIVLRDVPEPAPWQ